MVSFLDPEIREAVKFHCPKVIKNTQRNALENCVDFELEYGENKHDCYDGIHDNIKIKSKLKL